MKFDTICEILLYLINSTLFAKLFPFVKFEPIFETVQFLCNSALFAKVRTISKEETSLVQWDGILIWAWFVVREGSVSWNWRLSIVFGKHWPVFGCDLGGVCQREVIFICFFLLFYIWRWWFESRAERGGTAFFCVSFCSQTLPEALVRRVGKLTTCSWTLKKIRTKNIFSSWRIFILKKYFLKILKIFLKFSKFL